MNSKFEKHLNGVGAKASVLEIKNQSTPASFGNMPNGSSNPNDTYADYRGNAASVLKGSEIWKLNGSSLVLATSVNGDGSDYTSEFSASGAEDWIDATYTFDSAKLFVPYTQWILKLCGHNLFSEAGETIQFALTITIGEATITKDFEIARQANNFCKEFLIDFDEAADAVIKAAGADTMNVKLTCLDSTASATIYNGMSMLTVIQRRIDASAVASDEFTLDEIAAGYSHDLGWFATPEALQTAHPTGNNGDWAMVGSTDTVWIWDADSSAWVDSGNTDSANKNLSNLTSVGANISNWSSNVSNCITEIPQDINLTLSDGTLTLHTGSKLTNQDGTSVVTTVDRTYTQTGSFTFQGMVFCSAGGVIQGITSLDKIYSGTTEPLSPANFDVFFNTTTNTIELYSGGQWISWAVKYPIAVVSIENGVITSIDQVFNGFGYIGNTIFALPGVKVLYPDGRNANGTLKSGIISLTSVFINNLAYSLSDGSHILLTPYSVNASPVIIQDDEPQIQAFYERWYSPKLNLSFYHSEGATSWTQTPMALFGKVAKTSSTYTKFDPGQVFRALDYNDTGFIAHQAMPSGTYTNLTLPASGSTVTAPADGYLCFSKNSGAADEYVTLRNETAHNMSITSSVSNTGLPPCRAFLPVSKGDSVKVTYTLTGATDYFQFIYANGIK